jgi:sugar phosphate isomerase/epimerase
MSETRRIRIGNQTAFTALTPTQPFEFAMKNGFDAFEWFPDKKEWGAGWEESDLGAKTRRYIKRAALEHEIRLSVHAPWQVNPVQPEAWTRLQAALEFGEDIGASLLNVHLYSEEGVGAYGQAIIPLIKRLTRLGIELAIENTPLTGPEAFNELFERLRNLGFGDSSGVGMCLDVGHANLCQATRNDYLKFMDLLDPQVPIIHIHIHENYGDYDSHLPLFRGAAGQDASGIEELARHLIRRNFSGCVILEQWPQPPSLLNEARKKLVKIIDKVRLTVEQPGKDSSGRELPWNNRIR